ncbi:ATP-binding protein [Priestia megaterium]|uniref:AlbA family DNA-binding domain-containing protein n=1 Tax=Priestia megaterium TaxID=1404 RepID=UPI0021ABF689|nr:ATP-binding protein [Priestia megaterium]MCR8928845.1 ATP-binding protein [Priestia megaterium]
MQLDLKYTIEKLIKRKSEGDYWDYKEKWHTHNERLLHDILCFANTEHDKDCYIIFGVSDTGEVVGIDKNEQKKQADIIDLLRSFPFGGESVPKVRIETLEINDKTIDILIIFNSNDVPFYLKPRGKKYDCIREGFIYTRNGDSNTPINQNSNFRAIENLWKKRFSINKSIKERALALISLKSEWINESDEYEYYHKFQPAFTISRVTDYENNSPEFYSYVMTNEDTTYGEIKICYNGVAVDSYQTVILDSGRYVTTTPIWEWIKFGEYNKEVYRYKYFIKDQMGYKLHEFLFDETHEEAEIARKEFLKVILVFNSMREKEEFTTYIMENRNEFLNYIHDRQNEYSWNEQQIVTEINTGIALNKMLETYREMKDNQLVKL